MLVGVLLGAGPAVKKKTETALISLMKEIFKTLPENIDDPMALAIHVATQLENSPITNAGKGSSLNRDGQVECDACIVRLKSGRKTAASVGCLKHIRNPILVPDSLLKSSSESPSDLGRPLFMVGDGAVEYAKSKGLETGELVTQSQSRSHAYWEKMRDAIAPYKDTIGVLVASDEDIIVCSSSGGSILKHPGRVGSAAIPGAACDIEEGVAAICSGFGEDMMACRLANLACRTQLDKLPAKLKTYELQRQPYHGILRAERVPGGWQIEAAHSTESFAYGWTKIGGRPFIKVSKQPGLVGAFLGD